MHTNELDEEILVTSMAGMNLETEYENLNKDICIEIKSWGT